MKYNNIVHMYAEQHKKKIITEKIWYINEIEQRMW